MPPRVRTHTDLDAVRSAASAARAIEDVRGRFPGWSQHDGPGPNEVSFVLETQPWNYRIVVRARDDGAAKVFVRVWSRRALVLPPLARGGTMVLLGGVVLLGCGVGTAGAAGVFGVGRGEAEVMHPRDRREVELREDLELVHEPLREGSLGVREQALEHHGGAAGEAVLDEPDAAAAAFSHPSEHPVTVR